MKNYQHNVMTSPVKPSMEALLGHSKEEAADLIDGASLLSANEWVEVANYQKELDE